MKYEKRNRTKHDKKDDGKVISIWLDEFWVYYNIQNRV
jgi:hypothetical protein